MGAGLSVKLATVGALLVASCAARPDAGNATSTDKAAPMVTITGTVQRCEVRDISKRAGVENLRSYVTLAVEQTDPPDLKSRLGPAVELVGAAPFDRLSLAAGTQVTISTHYDAAAPMAPLAIRDVKK